MAEQMTNYECGPKALFAALKKHSPEFKMTYEEFLRYWKWPDTGTFRDNMRDQPGDHLQVLRNLKIQHRRVDIDDLINNRWPEGKTVVLLHDPADPILTQHWVRMIRFDRLSGRYHFDWGDGEMRNCSAEKLKESFEAGQPDYAYCLGESEPSTLNRAQNWVWLQLQKLTKRISSWL